MSNDESVFYMITNTIITHLLVESLLIQEKMSTKE